MDDHFAKSLGSAWTRIKNTLNTQQPHDSQHSDSRMTNNSQQIPPDTPDENSCMSVSEAPRSVDDHFAKCLGDTWFRIKAEQEALVAESTGLDEA